MGRLHQQARDLGRLAEDILAVAHLESGEFWLLPGAVDVRALVAVLAEQAAEPSRVQVEAPPGPVFVEADAERLRQALGNLLSNASKYSPHEASIRITIAATEDEAKVSVIDQGVGFAAEQIPQLFRKYSRLHDERTAGVEGVGLGLYLTRLLVEAHGGTIQAASPGPGRGATFTIILPRRRQELTADRRRPRTEVGAADANGSQG